jgi:hypothetical protein
VNCSDLRQNPPASAHDAGGFVWVFTTVAADAAVHHFTADRKQWILFEQTEPVTPGRPTFRRLALQHAIRHYCGSDDMRKASPALGTINANQKHTRNAA